MLFHEDCESRFGLLEDNSIDAVLTDPPFLISTEDITGGEAEIGGFSDRRAFQRDMGEWDKNFDPTWLVRQTARVLVAGGWFVVMCGDKLFGDYYNLIKYRGGFAFKFAMAWHKTNPAVSVRQATFVSSVEYILGGVKLDKGKKIPPNTWNWQGQAAMHNFHEGPICGGRQRLYWHSEGGLIFPCVNPRYCRFCQRDGKDSRQRHPTQKPLHIWKRLYSILTKPGQRVFDPYAGVGSSGMAAKKFKLDWFGSEREEEFAKAGKLWLKGRWFPGGNYQLDLFKGDEDGCCGR